MGIRAFGQQPGSIEPAEGSGDGDSQPVIGDSGPGSHIADYEYVSGGDVSEDSGGDSGFVDPSSVASDNSGGEAPFGRTATGRVRRRPVASKPGNSGTKRTARTEKQVSSLIADGVEWLHEIAAKVTKFEELEMSTEESLAIADAIVNVSEYYDVPIPDPKTMAWVNLGKVLAKAYGTRIVAARIRMKTERRKRGPVVVEPEQWPTQVAL